MTLVDIGGEEIPKCSTVLTSWEEASSLLFHLSFV